MIEERRHPCLGNMSCDSKLKFLGTITIIILGIFISWTGNQIGIVDSKVKFLGTIIILGIVISWSGNQITFKIISKKQGSSVWELGSKLGT